jgi:hypothetical protein
MTGSFRGLNSYYKKSFKENPSIYSKLESFQSICEVNKKNAKTNVIIINGKHLNDCIKTTNKALIYRWGSKCKSTICYPPEIVQSVCNSENIQLFVVAEYYDNEAMMIDYAIDKPIFGIDTKYYKSYLTDKYLARFLNDLNVAKETTNRYLYFENGEFKESYNSVYDVKSD